ncbi:MAG TPA: metal-binding protein [Pyrinomonadaceae bacterium]|nr:metal-binding protein [Pyrinomonadaceae bacterium]
MPSGKTHDLITVVLAAPTFAAAWGLTGSWGLAAAATAATLFGGLMFGPDLDIQSKQYTRWGVFRFLWFPYKVAFRHRSRWSHGIIFGTFIRVVYFAGALVLLGWAGVYLRAVYVAGGAPPGWAELAHAWRVIEAGALHYGLGRDALLAVFAGLWWGAASHTLTDVAWSVVRKGSEIF